MSGGKEAPELDGKDKRGQGQHQIERDQAFGHGSTLAPSL
jgi:hypothetical protein